MRFPVSTQYLSTAPNLEKKLFESRSSTKKRITILSVCLSLTGAAVSNLIAQDLRIDMRCFHIVAKSREIGDSTESLEKLGLSTGDRIVVLTRDRDSMLQRPITDFLPASPAHSDSSSSYTSTLRFMLPFCPLLPSCQDFPPQAVLRRQASRHLLSPRDLFRDD